ncbi:MAG TPA: hypothetical protein VFH51_06370, partial [Myxococcota bacterium]|nr:hypothetical protein [Myxococcota bacterium]
MSPPTHRRRSTRRRAPPAESRRETGHGGSGHIRRILVGLCLTLGVGVLGAATWLRFGMADVSRGALAARLLTRLLPGTFEIDALAWGADTRLHLTGICIAAPGGDVVARADAVAGELRWLPLLRSELVFEHLLAEAPWVQVHKDANAPVVIETAFHTPKPAEGPGPPPSEAGLRVSLRDVNVRDADLRVEVAGVRVHARHMSIQGADFWVQGDGLDLSIDLTADVELWAPTFTQAARGVRIQAAHAHYVSAHDYNALDMQRLHITA